MKQEIRAGRMDKTITIQRSTQSKDAYGAVTDTWADLMTVRAELVENNAQEFLRNSGESSERVAVFKIWFRDVGLFDRVSYAGRIFNIEGMKELSRRQGLELHCRAVGP
jgi:SPP1 family predicted phage head-tail adaptor